MTSRKRQTAVWSVMAAVALIDVTAVGAADPFDGVKPLQVMGTIDPASIAVRVTCPDGGQGTSMKGSLRGSPIGTGTFTFELGVTGAYAPDWRQRYLADGTRRERAQHDLAGEIGAFEMAAGKAGVEVNDLDDEDQPVRIRVKGRALGFARHDGDVLSVPAGPTHQLVREYASLSKRALDIDLHALTSREDEWTLRLPAGTRVTRAPTPSQLDTPFGRFSVSFEEGPGKVVVKTSLVFKKARITPAASVSSISDNSRCSSVAYSCFR